jgi:hypothetical protein
MQQAGIFGKRYVKPKKKQKTKKKPKLAETHKQTTLAPQNSKGITKGISVSETFSNKSWPTKAEKRREYYNQLVTSVNSLPSFCSCTNCKGRMLKVVRYTTMRHAYIEQCVTCFGVKFGKEKYFTEKEDGIICEVLNAHGPPVRRTTYDKWPNRSLAVLYKHMPKKSEEALMKYVNENFTTTHSQPALRLQNYKGWYKKI